MPVCTIPIMILTFPIRINCVSRFFCNFADETSRAVAFSGLANRAFFTCHGGQGTMWKTMLNFKNNVEWKRIFYPSSLRSLLKHPSLHLLNHSMHRLETVVSTLPVLHTIILSSMSLYVVALMYPLIPQHYNLTLFISSWATKSCPGFCHVRIFTYLSVAKRKQAKL